MFQNYGKQNFGGYKPHTYGGFGIDKVKGMGEELFYKHDHDRSGTLSMQEIPGMMMEFYQKSGCPPPSAQDMCYYMYMFDIDGDGQISFHEFKMMLKALGGIKSYDRQTI